MPDTPIEQLVIDALLAALAAMVPPTYTYQFVKVVEVKDNVLTLADTDKPFCVVATPYGIPFNYAGLQATGIRTPPLVGSNNVGDAIVYREMPLVVAFGFDATPENSTNPLSVDRVREGRLMHADLIKCLATLGNNAIGGSPVEVDFQRQILDLTEIESPLVYGELYLTVTFRHRYGDATRI